MVWAIANLTFLRDDDGNPINWVGQFQDISERRRDEKALQETLSCWRPRSTPPPTACWSSITAESPVRSQPARRP